MFTLFSEIDAFTKNETIVASSYEYFLFFPDSVMDESLVFVHDLIWTHVLEFWVPYHIGVSLMYLVICLIIVHIISW